MKCLGEEVYYSIPVNLGFLSWENIVSLDSGPISIELIEASEHQDLLQLLRWTFSAADVFLRTIYNEGVWMPRASAEAVVRAGFALGDA